jgi:hypothetical protein
MLKVEMAPLVIPLLLIATPTVADVTSELARCELEAERLFPAPHNKGAQNWPERASNLQKRAENIETCMRAATTERHENKQGIKGISPFTRTLLIAIGLTYLFMLFTILLYKCL